MVVTEPGLYLTVILYLLCLRIARIETVLVCSIEFVSNSCCYCGFSLFTMVTHVWCSVHLNNHQKALLYIGYTVGGCNAHTYSVWDVCSGVVVLEQMTLLDLLVHAEFDVATFLSFCSE